MEVIKSNISFNVVDGVLIKMKRLYPIGAKSVCIPRTLSGNVEIKAIGPNFCEGEYNKITIDNKIKEVRSDAFRLANVREVVWSSGCDAIPTFCFSDSAITVLSNIEHVKYIGNYAFSNTSLKEFVWPSMCSEIPDSCFLNSTVQYVRNIRSVEYVGPNAFAGSNIAEIRWPSACHTIPHSCFSSSKLSKISNIQDVTVIEDFAFDTCMIEEFVVPCGVTKLPCGVFAWCERLKKLVLHNDITDIGNSAFSYTSVPSFEWPENCSVVSDYCFSYSEVERISFHFNIEKIGRGAFSNCDKLDCVDLSCLMFCEFDRLAFDNIGSCKVLMPYYISPEEIDKIKA